MERVLAVSDVVLVYPQTGMDIKPTIAPPHSLLAIAAPLYKEGYKVKIIDQRVDRLWKQHMKEELQTEPICVGISTMTGTQIHFALEAAKVVRRYKDGKIPLVWGGAHPSTLPEQTCRSEYVDYVCFGEGDVSFLELVRALARENSPHQTPGVIYKNGSSIHISPSRPLLDVEQLDPVPWDLINVEDYIHRDMYLKKSPRTLDIGQTSRGCPFQCGFCSSASIRQRKWRAMSPMRALMEIQICTKRFRLSGIWIRDDEFYINRQRAYEICKGMIGLKINWYTSGTRVDVFNGSSDEQIAMLKRSGASVLKFGAESGSNRILKLMNKGITVEEIIECNLRAKRHGIIPAFAFMQGFPTETFQEINQTINLALRLKEDNPQAQFEALCPYTALPGTPMYQMALTYGLKPPDTLEGWASWIFENTSIEKMPWFDYAERQMIRNLAEMWILANGVPNTVDGLSSPWRQLIHPLATMISRYFRFRLKKKSYLFVPELMPFEWLHQLMIKARIVLK